MRGRLNVVTQETRFSLIQDILGHPAQLPTLKELPKDQRQNDLPYKFYGLSKDGRVFLEEHGLLRAEETLTEIYNTVDKTEAIQRYETAHLGLNANRSVVFIIHAYWVKSTTYRYEL